MGASCEAVVVPNGVDVEHFSREVPHEDLEAVKRAIGKGPDDIFLVTASRLVEKNAIGDIVSALAYMPANVKLLILGQGELEKPLRERVKKLRLEERVEFLGFIGHEDLPTHLKACDIFIRPSLSEGFGNSFIEAMAARIPVIATRVGGIVDFLKDKETGLFCEVNSPEDIARKAEIFIRDRNLRDEIVENAFRMVRERYDWSLVASDMKEKAFDPLFRK
jgi:glycosyltransferase involved in cell wall biosynthesis